MDTIIQYLKENTFWEGNLIFGFFFGLVVFMYIMAYLYNRKNKKNERPESKKI